MAASNDIIKTTLSYVDNHLAIALLDTIQTQNIGYSDRNIAVQQYTLCRGTQLYSDLIDLAEEAVPEGDVEAIQAALRDKQELLSTERERLLAGDGVARFKSFLSTEENKQRYAKMCDDHTIVTRGLDTFGLTEEHLNDLFVFARASYQYGQYHECREILYFLGQVKPEQYRSDEQRLWGQLACEILCAKNGISGVLWQDAIRTLNSLFDIAESTAHPRVTIEACMHWQLFTHMLSQVPDGRNELVERFSSDMCFPVLISHAQHLMRYLIVCVLITPGIHLRGCPHQHPAIRDLAKAIKEISFVYRDAIIDVFSAMFVTFDTNSALTLLPTACETVEKDIFLNAYIDDFTHAIRQRLFEDHCKGHANINMQDAAYLLGVPMAESEKWTVDFIRNSKLNEKVREDEDSVAVHCMSGTNSVLGMIGEKMRSISTRLEALMMSS